MSHMNLWMLFNYDQGNIFRFRGASNEQLGGFHIFRPSIMNVVINRAFTPKNRHTFQSSSFGASNARAIGCSLVSHCTSDRANVVFHFAFFRTRSH